MIICSRLLRKIEGTTSHDNMYLCAVLCPEWKKWWLKHPNLEIVPPIRAKIVGEKHKLVFLVVVICYLVVVNWL